MQTEIGALQNAGSWLDELCLLLFGPPSVGHDCGARGGRVEKRGSLQLEHDLSGYI